MLEKYNLNHQGDSSGDSFSDWLYEQTESDAPESNVDFAWNRISNQIESQKPKNLFFVRFVKVAAAISLIAIATFIVVDVNDQPELLEYATNDVKEIVSLPDGSKVVLNANSSLSFLEEFGETRTVSLQGEAYFDIKSDDTPFVVELGDAAVRVLGTSFNINRESDEIVVFVKSGKVAFESVDQRVELTQNQFATLNIHNQKIHVSDTAPANTMSWRTGEFDFNEIPLSEAIGQLERYYDVTFKVNSKVGSCKVTAQFDKAPLGDVIDVLESILDVNIKWSNSTVVIKGKGC